MGWIWSGEMVGNGERQKLKNRRKMKKLSKDGSKSSGAEICDQAGENPNSIS